MCTAIEETNVEANIEPCCKMLQDIGSSLKMVNYFVIATFCDVARCLFDHVLHISQSDPTVLG